MTTQRFGGGFLAFDDTQLSVLALFWAGMMSWIVDSPMKHICVQLDSANSKSYRNAKPRYNKLQK
jgi:hypothetical protein